MPARSWEAAHSTGVSFVYQVLLLVCLPKGDFPTTGISCTWTACSFSKAVLCLAPIKSPILILLSSVNNRSKFPLQYCRWDLIYIHGRSSGGTRGLLSIKTSSYESRDLQYSANPLRLCNCYWTAATFQLENTFMIPEEVLNCSQSTLLALKNKRKLMQEF